MVKRKSESLSVLVGVGILALATLSSGGLAYSFYRTEIAEEKEESSDMANDDSPFEQLKKEKNMVITPVPTDRSGSGTTKSNNSGIPIGTYSNPPTTINPTSNLYSTEAGRRINNIDSIPDYSSPASSNNFNSTNNSLIKPLEDNSFLDTPSTDNPSWDTSPLEESPF